MVIVEYQENSITRSYNLPDDLRHTATEFFDFLVAEGDIVRWEFA
jgi:hypothetical protein